MQIISEKSIKIFEKKHKNFGGLFEYKPLISFTQNPNSSHFFIMNSTTDLRFPLCLLYEIFIMNWYGDYSSLKIHLKPVLSTVLSRPDVTINSGAISEHNFIKNEIPKIAEKIYFKTKSLDKYALLSSIFDYVTSYFSYSTLPPTLYDAYNSHQGDCLDQSSLFTEIARCFSIETYLVGGIYSDKNQSFYHAWTLSYPAHFPHKRPLIADPAMLSFDIPYITYFQHYRPETLEEILTRRANQLNFSIEACHI